MTGPEVRPVLRLVPTGLRDGRLHMTLIATPVRCSAGGKRRGFPLDEWSLRARDWIFGPTGELRIDVDSLARGGNATSKPWSAAHRAWRAKNLAGAWKAIVPEGANRATCWTRLADSIELSLSSKTFTNDLPKDDKASPDDPGSHLDDTGAYKEKAIEASGSLAVRAVVPVKHGDLAVLLEFERARVVHDQLAGASDHAKPTCDPTLDAAPASLPTGGTPKEALTDAKKSELTRAFRLVADERRKGAPNGACAAIVRPKLARGTSEARKESALATHIAGSWPQAEPAAQAKTHDDACKDRDAVAQTLAAYQAIASSPSWSRIFGFAFDVSMEWKGPAPKRISAGEWTLPPGCGANKTVWTAVGPDGWPAPLSEKTSLVVEGLLRMGRDCAHAELPRFDAVTLDVRQAAEAAARPLAGPKRGFRTSGLTLIDRSRADDVRRQIARTDSAMGDSTITLYADDLLVGRRLDVGIQTKSGIAWRPLGARAVAYGLRKPAPDGGSRFEPIDAGIIEELLGPPEGPSGARTLEQAQVNAASRLTPSPGGDDKQCEVFVDEAFVTWDGMPMGVHTGLPPEVAAQCQDDAPRFPFLQRQSLPVTGGVDRPAPLRYGRSYRFGMRAVFLGGCSKGVGEASKLYDRDVQEFTYPSDPDKDSEAWPLRRFVRQEAIGAPVVLLPGSVLGQAPGEMDFENSQSAILRSVPPGYLEPEDLPAAIAGRRYVKARERVSDDKLVRVFVPPTVALDDMLRAGAFDDAGRRTRVGGGGLVGVAYGMPDRPDPASRDGEPAGGFPIAVVDGRRAFEVAPTRRGLTPGWGAPQDDQTGVHGASLFIATAALGAKAGRFARRAYFPDPHATKLILRLRRRSDGNYVEATCAVPVYDAQSRYPDAMPTIVVIRKRGGKSAGAAGPPLWSKAKAVRFDGLNLGAKQGQRVQRVDLTLGLGDDFDLEAAYLPDRDVLARQFALVETIAAYRLAVARDPNEKKPPPKTKHVTTGSYAVPDDETLRKVADELTTHLTGTAPNASASVPAADLPPSTSTQAPRGPIEELAAVTTVRVAHVVNRPMVAASFSPAAFNVLRPVKAAAKASPCGDLDEIADQLSQLTPPGDQAPPPAACAKKLLDAVKAGPSELATKDYLMTGRIAFDRATTSAIEILATCVSPRDPRFDDPLRKRSLKARIAGTWPRRTHLLAKGRSERVPAEVLEVYGFEDIDPMTGAVTLKRSDVILLRIDHIAGPGSGALTPAPKAVGDGSNAGASELRDEIEIGLAHLAALGGKPVQRPEAAGVLFAASQLHTFPDGKARKLLLRLRAISRFATDFETTPRWSTEASGRDATVRLRQSLQVSEQSIDSAPAPEPDGSCPGAAAGGMIEVWLPASRRPDKCAPSSPVPVFHFIRGREGRMFTVTRRSGVRVYLERDWYSSGEGEQLGVVLHAGSGAGRDNSVSMSDEELGPLGPHVSRWGGDPIRRDFSPMATPLTAASFGFSCGAPSNAPSLVRKVAIPVQVPGTEQSTTLLVEADVLTYTPCFDVDREQWFVDLDLQAAETPNPFVRLGLIRFQAHAIDPAQQASEPVAVWTQLLPERTLWTEAEAASPNNNSINVHAGVTGSAHLGVRLPTAPVGTDASTLSAIDQAAVRFRLVHESDVDGVMRRSLLREISVTPCSVLEAHTSWKADFNLGKADLDVLGPGTVYIYAEEVESFLPASYGREPADIATIFNAKTLTEAGPRFAARLEIEMDQGRGSATPRRTKRALVKDV